MGARRDALLLDSGGYALGDENSDTYYINSPSGIAVIQDTGTFGTDIVYISNIFSE
jgi:hypothetical protein